MGQQSLVFPNATSRVSVTQSSDGVSRASRSLNYADLLKDSTCFESYQMAVPEWIYANSINELQKKVKEKVFEEVYNNFCLEHSDLVCFTLKRHARNPDLIKIPVQDRYMKTKRREKNLGLYKYFLDNVVINTQAINYISSNIDEFFNQDLIVLYNTNSPVNPSQIAIYDYAREQFQNVLVSYQYKIGRGKEYKGMPKCPLSDSSGNQFMQLIECVTGAKTIRATIMCYINFIHLEEQKVKVDLKVFNTRTLSLIDSREFEINYRGANNNSDIAKDAIRKIFDNKENIDKIILQLTERFYSFVTNGKEYRIIIYPSAISNIDIIDWITYLKLNGVNVKNHDSDENVEEIVISSLEINQSNLVQSLNQLKKGYLNGKIKSNGDVIEIK